MWLYVGDKFAFTHGLNDKGETIKVGGVSAIRRNLPFGQNPAQTLVEIKHNNDYITLQIINDDKDEKIETVVNQILLTFKFTQISQSKNMQSYTFAELNFAYPSDWKLEKQNDNVIIHPSSLPVQEQFPGISFSVVDNPTNLTVEEYDNMVSKEGMDPGIYSAFHGDKEVIASPKVANGINGFLLQDNNCEPLSCDVFSFTANKKLYIVRNVFESMSGKSDLTKQELRTTFDQILSTLNVTQSE
jgi:hypothetical protein